MTGAMQSQPSFTVLPGRGVLTLDGPDMRAFLQGLVSNDVGRLAADRATYAALLTPQGKYLFDFLLYQAGDRILLETAGERLADLTRRLVMYRLRAQVGIEVAPGHAVGVVFGKGAAALLGLPETEGAAREEEGLVLAVDPRAAALGVRLIGPDAAVHERLARLGVPEMQPGSWERLRITQAAPDGTSDLVVERSTLLESNFEELNGVSFDKGCFIGQELTARMKHRGLVKKRLVPVRIEGPALEPGTPIMAGDREAGELRGSMGDLGLALLRLEHLASDGLTAGGARIVPAPPAWLHLKSGAA